MPGPKSNPKPADQYDDETREFRAKVGKHPQAARLAARREDYDTFTSKVNAFDGEFTKPGSQNRNK